jgi:hypothetical protein
MKWSLNKQSSGSRVNIAHTEEDCDMIAKTCGSSLTHITVFVGIKRT